MFIGACAFCLVKGSTDSFRSAISNITSQSIDQSINQSIFYLYQTETRRSITETRDKNLYSDKSQYQQSQV